MIKNMFLVLNKYTASNIPHSSEKRGGAIGHRRDAKFCVSMGVERKYKITNKGCVWDRIIIRKNVY